MIYAAKRRMMATNGSAGTSNGGVSWHVHGTTAHDRDQPLAGDTEPQATGLPVGSLLAVLRTECNKTGPMYRTRSTDGGKTWPAPEDLRPSGVLPQLLTLDNAVTVLSARTAERSRTGNRLEARFTPVESPGGRGRGGGGNRQDDPDRRRAAPAPLRLRNRPHAPRMPLRLLLRTGNLKATAAGTSTPA